MQFWNPLDTMVQYNSLTMTDTALQSEAFLPFDTSTSMSACTSSNNGMLNDIHIPLSPIVLKAYGSNTTTTTTTTTTTDPLLRDNIDMSFKELLSSRHQDEDDLISYYDTDLEVSQLKTEVFSRSNLVSNDPLLAMPLSEILNDFDTLINPVPLRDDTTFGQNKTNLTEPSRIFRQKGADHEIYRPSTTRAFAPLPLPLRTAMIMNTNTNMNTNHYDFAMLTPLNAVQTTKDRPLTTQAAFVGMSSLPPFVPHPVLGSRQRMANGDFPIAASLQQRKVIVPPRPTPVTPEPDPNPNYKDPLELLGRSLFQSHQSNRYHAYQLFNWSQRYQQAKEYSMAHGHCVIPHECVLNPGLAKWAKRQRSEYQIYAKRRKGPHDRKVKSSMSKERVQLLNDIGFCWCHNKSSWNLRYQELCSYNDKHNHTLVAPNENRKLAVWVKAQRRQFRLMKEGAKSSMTSERCDHLDKIGFVWRINKAWKKATKKGKVAHA
jgi:hypothetical protein